MADKNQTQKMDKAGLIAAARVALADESKPFWDEVAEHLDRIGEAEKPKVEPRRNR